MDAGILIVGILVLPTVASIAEDAMTAVPAALRGAFRDVLTGAPIAELADAAVLDGSPVVASREDTPAIGTEASRTDGRAVMSQQSLEQVLQGKNPVEVRTIPPGAFEGRMEALLAETMERTREALGLNEPLFVQYVAYLGAILRVCDGAGVGRPDEILRAELSGGAR